MPLLLLPHITPAICRSSPSSLFVFGDNLKGWGRGGQAIIRGQPNACGLQTKRDPQVYLSDSDLPIVIAFSVLRIERLRLALKQDLTVYWPADGIGTGRAKLLTKAPAIAGWYWSLFERLRLDFNSEQTPNPQEQP